MLILLTLWELLSAIGPWWILFAVIAFCTARYCYWWCVPVGHCVIGAILFVLDSLWDAEFRRSLPPGTGELEIPALGILIHVLLVNTLLLPVTWLGGRGRQPDRTPRPKQYDIIS
jgi:hypothetical protein